MELSEQNHLILFIIFLVISYIIVSHIVYHIINVYSGINTIMHEKDMGLPWIHLNTNIVEGYDNNPPDWEDLNIPDLTIGLNTEKMKKAVESLEDEINKFGDKVNQVVDGLNKVVKFFGGDPDSIPSVPSVDIKPPDPPGLSLKPIRDALRTIINPLIDVFTKTIPEWFNRNIEKPVIAIGDEIVDEFKNIKARFDAMGHGIVQMRDGVGQQFTGMGEGLQDGFFDIGLLLKFSGEYVGSNIECGISLITGFGSCWIYYIVEVIAHAIYLLPATVIYGFYLFGMDVYPHEKAFWEKVREYDNTYLYNNTGWGVSQWPKFVKENCYSCIRLKSDAMELKAKQVQRDFTTGIKDKMNVGFKTFNTGATEIKDAFSKDFKA